MLWLVDDVVVGVAVATEMLVVVVVATAVAVYGRVNQLAAVSINRAQDR